MISNSSLNLDILCKAQQRKDNRKFKKKKSLKKKVKNLENRIDNLQQDIEMLKYAPPPDGGPMYKEASKHFEEQLKKL